MYLPQANARVTRIVTPNLYVGTEFLVVKFLKWLKKTILCIIYLKSKDFSLSFSPINRSRVRASAVVIYLHVPMCYVLMNTIHYLCFLQPSQLMIQHGRWTCNWGALWAPLLIGDKLGDWWAPWFVRRGHRDVRGAIAKVSKLYCSKKDASEDTETGWGGWYRNNYLVRWQVKQTSLRITLDKYDYIVFVSLVIHHVYFGLVSRL